MASNKNETIAKLVSVVMLLSFVFFVYKHNNSVNAIINNKIWEKSNKIENNNEKEILKEKIDEKWIASIGKYWNLSSPFLKEQIWMEIVSTNWFSVNHKWIDYALIEEIDYWTQVKLQAVSSGTIYYWIWKAPKDSKFIDWTRKEYGWWWKFAMLDSWNGNIYIYAHLEEFNKELFKNESDSLQKVVSKLMFPTNIWKNKIWFDYDRDITIYKGVSVNAGDYIGDMWNTGMSYGLDRGDAKKTGKHLHFQIYEKGNIRDVCENKVCDKVYKSWNPEKFWINSFYNEYEAAKKYLDSKK